MAKFHVSRVEVIETDLYEVWGEDEKLVVYDLNVRAFVDGEIYDHKHIFKGVFKDEREGLYHADMGAKKHAHDLANRVADRGIIDTDHWISY